MRCEDVEEVGEKFFKKILILEMDSIFSYKTFSFPLLFILIFLITFLKESFSVYIYIYRNMIIIFIRKVLFILCRIAAIIS